VQVKLVPAGATTAEGNRVESCLRILCHEIEVATFHSCCHGGDGNIIVSGLAGNVAKSIGGEIGAKNKQFAMVKTMRTGIGKDGVAHLVKSRPGSVGPVWGNVICILIQEDDSEGRDAHFEVGNEPSIKLDESDKFCDVADQYRGRPRVDEVVFGHGRAIVVDAYIDADKFEPFDKVVQFLQTEG
jgi:hypothetical protein